MSSRYLVSYHDGNTGHLRADCPSCLAELNPTLHLPNPSGACQQGCAKEWQTAGAHLRWACGRCGWTADDACTSTLRDITHSGRPVEVPVEDIPF